MNLDTIFPAIELSHAELHEIATALTQPAVKKYFKQMQAGAFKAIANGLPKEGQSDAEYLREQAQVVGTLAALETLLSIETPPSA